MVNRESSTVGRELEQIYHITGAQRPGRVEYHTQQNRERSDRVALNITNQSKPLEWSAEEECHSTPPGRCAALRSRFCCRSLRSRFCLPVAALLVLLAGSCTPGAAVCGDPRITISSNPQLPSQLQLEPVHLAVIGFMIVTTEV